jgi:membrane protease YdiL (CAAX protease family)
VSGKIIAVWQRLPLFARALIVAFLVLNVGTTATIIPLVGNLKFLPIIPWALPATFVITWLFWLYFTGAGWPAQTRTARQHIARRKSLPPPVWRSALLPLLLSLVAMLSLRLILPSIFPVSRPQLPIDPSLYPITTVFGLALSVAFSAGVVEEVAFRGYLQKPLEEAYGIVPALLITGGAFWFAHVPKVTLNHLPFHLLASILLGVIAYRTNCLLPAIVGHTVGDALLLPAYAFHRPAIIWSLLASRPVWANSTTTTFSHKLGIVTHALAPSSLLERGSTQAFAVVAWVFLLSVGPTFLSFKLLPGAHDKPPIDLS